MQKSFLSLIFYVILFFGLSDQCPNIVTRASWGARSANTAILPTRPAPFIVIHHTAGAACNSRATCNQQMRNIQNMHMNNNGWADIGYNFCIGGDGDIYEGRGWDRQGAHAPSFNSRSLGICFIGHFSNGLPTVAARSAAQALLRCGVTRSHIRSDYSLMGHRQASATECPGTALFNEIRTWPRFNPNPR